MRESRVQPDLVQRIQQNVALTPYDRDTFYVYGPSNFTGMFSFSPFSTYGHRY